MRGLAVAGLTCLALAFASSTPAANVVVINNDGADEGFNDPTPADPEGGNPGTTLGEQRLIAAQFAADLIGSKLISNVTITIAVEFNPQECTPSNGTIGSAGAETLVANFANAPRADTFYPVALGNALAGKDLDPGTPDIGATFNSSIDNNLLCLAGTDWYYGLDDEAPDGDLNFIATATHELVHGLGFATFTDLVTGQFFMGMPDIYAAGVFDLLQGQTWTQMTAVQRAASAQNDGNVVWDSSMDIPGSPNSTTSNGAPSLDEGTASGRVQLFAPLPLQQGSSISHWDDALQPDALMEPFVTDVVGVTEGIGLAACLLQDIGWRLSGSARCPDDSDAPPLGSGGSGGNGSGGGSVDDGGGGCSLVGPASPDPLFPLLLAVVLAVLVWRRRT